MAACAEPLVGWIISAFGAGTWVVAWPSRAQGGLLDSYRSEPGEAL